MIAKATHPTQYIYGFSPDRQSPNKTPEPTATSVTPRAIEHVFELKRKNPDRDAARGVPAVAVAHL